MPVKALKASSMAHCRLAAGKMAHPARQYFFWVKKELLFLREVVSNFQESGDRSKNSTFLFAPKDPFGELFGFWQMIRKFEIGQNALL